MTQKKIKKGGGDSGAGAQGFKPRKIKVPDTSKILKQITDEKKPKKRTMKICECGDPVCRSPITDPSDWSWIEVEVDENGNILEDKE